MQTSILHSTLLEVWDSIIVSVTNHMQHHSRLFYDMNQHVNCFPHQPNATSCLTFCSWGSSSKGWLIGLQRHNREEATQATMILQRSVEGDFAQWNGRRWELVAARWGQAATAVWRGRVWRRRFYILQNNIVLMLTINK